MSQTHRFSGEILFDALRVLFLPSQRYLVHGIGVLILHGQIVRSLVLETQTTSQPQTNKYSTDVRQA